jgi:hypothetical protein
MRNKSISVVLFMAFILGTTVPLVYAHPWAAIENSGYAITMYDPPHGTGVFPVTDVTLRAGTTHYVDEDVHNVTFRWMPPAGSGLSEVLHEYIPLSASSPPEYTKNGDLIYDAFDSLTIEAIGGWGVQAWFHDSRGNIRHRTDIISIRAVSFNAVPEVPFGTIAILIAMFGALGILAISKKTRLASPPRTPC